MAGLSKLLAALALAAGVAPLSTAALRPKVDALVTAVAAARHLPFHGTLPVRPLGPDALRQAAALTVGEATATSTARAEAKILARLGLVPAGFASGEAAAHAYGAAAGRAPRYDAATGALLVPDFVPFETQRLELAHEIAHAVADQHFGLRRFLGGAPGSGPPLDGDAARARLAIVEGDAMLTGLELVDPTESFLGPHALRTLADRLRTDGPPTWFPALGELTHIDGLLFVAGVRARHPWTAVDALWTDPPDSTEQILHPEKYDACEAPIAVALDALPELAGRGRPTASTVIGEWAIRLWLATAVSPVVASRAAAGWGGDRAGLYTAAALPVDGPDGGAAPPASRPAVAWLTVWDDPAEADDFARAARQVLAQQAAADGPPPAGAQPDEAADDRATFPMASGSDGLARRGDAVALLFGAPAPTGPALDAMLDAAHLPPSGATSRRAAPRPRRGAQPGCSRRDRAAAPG